MELWYVTENKLTWNGAARKWTHTERIVAVNVNRYQADALIEHNHDRSAAPQQAGHTYEVGPNFVTTF